ncbi:MAG: amino acid ABC transporter permease [Gulosibacter sp.]|uniref:amino acid ABC transporter permease n=1 Tax=Gulosibacter sp. TaxID=2817531 RepID=UPI003F90F6FC
MNLIEFLPRFGEGLLVSLQLTVISVFFGYLIGTVFAVSVTAANPWIRWIALVLVEIGRGIPALVVLYIVYYGLPALGILLDNFGAAAVGLTFTVAAYSSEMIRAGLASVPRGQQEGADALGLSKTTTFLRVIVPQGIRSAIPPLMGLAIMSFQGTSLAYSISVNELMSQAYQVSTISFRYLEVYGFTALLYACIAVPTTWLSVWMEKRLNRGFVR